MISVNGISEIVAECRKAIEKGCSVFVDYNCRDSGGSVDEENSKKFVDGMKRSFQNVEVLITLSSIHSELYNKKVLAKYKRISDGISLNHLDECLNFGSIFNLSEEYPELPMVFYGTGRVIPDDLESASKEKIIAGLFKL